MSYSSIITASQRHRLDFNQKRNILRKLGNNHPITNSVFNNYNCNKTSNQLQAWTTGFSVVAGVLGIAAAGFGLFSVLNNLFDKKEEGKNNTNAPKIEEPTSTDVNKTLIDDIKNAKKNYKKANEKQDAMNLLKQKINKAEDQLETYQTELSNLNETIDEATVKIDNITKNIDDNTKKIDTLEESISDLKNQISELKDGTPEEQAMAQKLENQIADKKAERKTLMEEIDNLIKQREEQRTIKKEAENNFKTIEASKKELEKNTPKIETTYFEDKPETQTPSKIDEIHTNILFNNIK